MELRHKFGLLALIYVASLSANLILSAWCIVVYFESAFQDYQATIVRQEDVEQLRTLLRRQESLFDEAPSADQLASAYEQLESDVSAAMSHMDLEMSEGPAAPLWQHIKALARRKHEAAAGRIAAVAGQASGPGTGAALADQERRLFHELDAELGQAGVRFSLQRHRRVDAAAATQQRVMSILTVSAVSGVILCAVGLFYVRRWVLRPVAELREATKQISAGNFAYRTKPRARDELGQLAGEVNQMSATIVDMQNRLVEQERLAAAGEMVTRLAHNIRNPLAGIRGLAEEACFAAPDQPDLVDLQKRIMETVDRFEKWLRDLQQSVSPMTLKPQNVRIEELIRGVAEALGPMSERRHVRLRVQVDPQVGEVFIDPLHFEQAAVSLVTNAVQASRAGQEVRLEVSPAANGRGRWQFTVRDEGVGIQPEVLDKIFLPYFTTKRDGNGVGLAMANKVVKLHGGQLNVESEPGRGSTFTATLPGLVNGA